MVWINSAYSGCADRPENAICEVSDEIWKAYAPYPHGEYWTVENGEFVILKSIEEIEHEDEVLAKINELKEKLADTDYQAIKFAEGELTEEEYTPIREQRKAWRKEINDLQEKYNL